MYVYLNDIFVREEDARVSVFDRGFLYGDGLFETMRAYDGCIFRLNRHLQRLLNGCSFLKIDLPLSAGELEDALYRLIRMNKLRNARIRLTVTRGTGGLGIDVRGCKSPTVVISSREYHPHPDELYRDGVSIGISSRLSCRMAPDNASLKSLNFIENILVRAEAKEGEFEMVMKSRDGYITEGTVSNIFFVKDGVLLTPSLEAGILRGITRDTVIEISGMLGIPLREGLFGEDELLSADEVFLTNTVIGIMPVRSVDGRGFRSGEITGRIMGEYRRMVEEESRGRD